MDINHKNKYLQTIQQAGLSKNEALIYLTLLENGELSMTSLSYKSGLKRPTTYNTIASLDLLGLTSKIQYGKRNFYSATHPKRLLQIIKFREKQIEKNIPNLLGIYVEKKEKPKVQMFEGLESLKQVYREAFTRLTQGEELLIFTNIGKVIKHHPWVIKLFYSIIGSIVYKSKVKELSYDNEYGKQYAEKILQKKVRGYELRLTKDVSLGENEIFIFNDKIIFFSLVNEIFVVSIESKDLTKTQKAMFEMAWEQAKKI